MFLGGMLIDILSWHWIFFMNIPFGIAAIILIQKSLKETFNKIKHKIDYAGIITLSMAMIIFLNIFVSGENKSSHSNIFIILSMIITIILLIIFYRIERKVEEPIIPFDIFTQTSVIVNIISFLISAVFIGSNVYLPIYIQNVLGFSAKVSGLALAPMSAAWLIASVTLGKCIVKVWSKSSNTNI